jgi:NAD+ kinase
VNIGLVVHAGRDRSLDVARVTAERLRADGVTVVVTRPSDPDDREGAELAALGTPVEADGFARDLDLVISLGGDGTFLRAAHLCRDDDVPVLGVNLGRLGFLAEVEVDDLDAALDAVLDGRFAVEERTTLEAVVADANGEEVARGWALNEVSVEKTARQRVLHMEVFVAETMFARIPADALVVATPTGSTAYALSAGGPILSPTLDATLVVPVAPHTLFDRTVVAGPDEEVRIELLTEQDPAVISCDGRDPVVLDAGGTIRVRGADHPVRIARTAPADFYRLVREKFGLR